MAWNFSTVGHGHDRSWWTAFVAALAGAGFDGTISIEYEDPFLEAEGSIIEAIDVLGDAIEAVPRQ